MSDLEDFDLRRGERSGEPSQEPAEPELGSPRQAGDEGPEAEPPRERFPLGLGLFASALMVGVLVLAWVVLRPRPRPVAQASPPAPASTAPLPSPSPTSAASPTPIDLPPLGQSDALVRQLAAGLSAHPQLALWLAQDDLVRRFSVVAANVAAGDNPRPHLAFLEPGTRLGVANREGRLVIHPASYARFDAFADGVASLDAAGCARVYRVLIPLFEAASHELGAEPGGFEATLSAAVQALLEVPVVEGDLPVRPVQRTSLIYEYLDPRLEGLSAPQKQLLRMGPANVRKVQAKLREVGVALGLRLPSGAHPAPGASAPS